MKNNYAKLATITDLAKYDSLFDEFAFPLRKDPEND